MLKIRPITCALAFILCSAIFNIYEDGGLYSWMNLALGLITGLPVMTCYFMSRGVRILLPLLSICVFSLALVGILDDVKLDRLFFSGVSLGVIAGWFPAFFIARNRAIDFIILCAKTDEYTELAMKLSLRFNR